MEESESGIEYNFKSKLSEKRLAIQNTFEMTNFLFEKEILSKFISNEEKSINFTSLTYTDELVQNALLYLVGLYKPNEDIKLDLSSYDYISIISNQKNLEEIFKSFTISDFENFKDNSIKLGAKEFENIFQLIQKVVYSNERNKIYILISPSNILWIKSQKENLSNNFYSLKLNKFNNIFFRKRNIELLLGNLGKHDRSRIGLISSMVKDNLNSCVDGMMRDVKGIKEIFETKKLLQFNQKFHDEIEGGKKFKRNFSKIMNDEKIHPSQLVIIESEIEKNSDVLIDGSSYSNSAIEFNVFNERFYDLSIKDQELIDEQVSKLTNYLEKMLNECKIDVREYLVKYKFEI